MAKIEVVEEEKIYNLQLLFWAKVDLELGSRTKTRSNTAK